MSYYPPYSYGLSGIKHVTVDVDLEGLTTKADLENITKTDISSLATKTNLSNIKSSLDNLKSEVDILDILRLSTVPDDLSKLAKEVQEDFTKKADFSALEKKK